MVAKLRYVVLAYKEKGKENLRWIMDLTGKDKAIHDLTIEEALNKRLELENGRKD